ncbi:MAG: ribonuclease R [candidate division Zixibacteria bacterium]|nr:ribonuclease R [candidate division Zixibacteria bacterium]
MNFTPDQIVAFIRQKSDQPMKPKELARALDIPRPRYPEFRQVIKSLLASGELVKLKRGRIGLAQQMDIVVGEISITRGGLGFVPQEGEEKDILIPAHALSTALIGDRVMVRLTGTQVSRSLGDRRTGTVVKIVERAQRNIVGVFRLGQHFAYVSPDNVRIHRDIYIPAEQTTGILEGQKVVCVITEWNDPALNPIGEITEVLGFVGDPGVDMLTVIKSFNLPEEFPDEIINAAERVTARDITDEMTHRLDLTADCVYTIDPADAKDHDDAVSVEETPNGYRLGVHIADVSFWVEPGTALDKEAFHRGNSVYLPGMVIPMLPEVLSNDVCSLRPNRKRLAHSVLIDFDKKGKMVSWKVADTLIKSCAKLSYEDVQDFFDNGLPQGTAASRLSHIADSLTLAKKLAAILSRKRFGEGSLDFDLPEAKIILDDDGDVIELGNRVRLESHRLVEEFMLAANQAVALELFRNGLQLLYRVHGRPDLEKLEAFSSMMTKLGYSFPVSDTIRPIQLARFLEKVKGVPEEEFINELLLRSMQKAVYQRENIGHFGLAFTHYAHFTSPIRRYPDLLIHRLLRARKNGRYESSFAKRISSVIDHVGTHCSETERTAEKAERRAVKVKQVQYMARHVGDEFDGIVAGVMSFGFFVRLDGVGAEGLVRISNVDDDYYRHDEQQSRLVGRNSGRTFRLGDRLRVGITKVDTDNHEIDLFVVDDKPPRKRASSKGHGRTGRKAPQTRYRRRK